MSDMTLSAGLTKIAGITQAAAAESGTGVQAIVFFRETEVTKLQKP
jgi:hypothetical protein